MIGSTISHYKILEKLGEGGMGVVYKAQDLKLDRLVALKFLPHHLTANETEKARFLQEAKAAAALNHPNVCSVIDIQEYEGEQFIVMEFVDGMTLRQRIAVKGDVTSPLPMHDAIAYAIQIGEALQEAHSKGIVHRDIKADNILINSKNQVKVMDFGLAKMKGAVGLTKAGSTVGTIAYMSPEQIQGSEVDHRTDLWSFGIVFYEMLTGHRPFRGEHEAAVMYEILNVDPMALETYRSDIPDHIQDVFSRLLQKDPLKRLASASEIVQRLKAAPSKAAPPASEKSIAVLYFENMSSEKESEYF